jgi:hypothetical protein
MCGYSKDAGATVNKKFSRYVNSLPWKLERLLAMAPVQVCNLPKNIPPRGIYLFSNGDEHWYVGRTNRLRARLSEHCRKSSTHNSAPFAFLVARKMTGMSAATYRLAGSRKELSNHEIFGPAFIKAKAQVAEMNVRFVEEKDPICQALLEIYVALTLGTKHNSFENH